VLRLGKNLGSYLGETIDIHQVLRDIEAATVGKNWECDIVPLTSIEADPPVKFVAYRRLIESPRNRIYISAGIHGDEPAGPLAVLQLLQEDCWPADASIWLCPCLNPTGFSRNTRENHLGIDLNRDYRHLQSEEVRTHIAWLQQQPNFNLSLCLHEDWESLGFYVYEVDLEQRASLADKMMEAVAKVCPIDPSPIIETRPAEKGIIRPLLTPMERPQWPEAFFLITHKSPLSYTLEAPSDFPLSTRVAALVTAVRSAMEQL
jgi:protein MpaA